MVGRRASSDLQRHDEKVSSKHDSNPENIVGRKVIRFSLHPEYLPYRFTERYGIYDLFRMKIQATNYPKVNIK